MGIVSYIRPPVYMQVLNIINANHTAPVETKRKYIVPVHNAKANLYILQSLWRLKRNTSHK